MVYWLGQSVKALSASDWQAGNIINDAVFYNNTAMSVDEIQLFLNAKVPSCDNMGSKQYGGTGKTVYQYFHPAPRNIKFPVTCLREYYENPDTHANNLTQTDGQPAGPPPGSISAAQIIWNAAQNYHINPQVLLVLLQKESGLITDDSPLPIQYQTATGYGCPDFQGCNSSYAGFYNQVTNAAWQFRQYATNPNAYPYIVGSGNTILWNPNSGCGSASVNIANQPTASLYNYTPYQPNQAALNNLNGTGDGCSSYGNRNFWRDFNNWFGNQYILNFVSYSGYPTIKAGQSATVWIRYRNDGTGTFYDSTLSSNPLHLANSNPINRSSNFYDSTTWLNNSRPSDGFKVYQSDGTTLASNQHTVTSGQIVEFRFTYSVPINTPAGTYHESIQPVREYASQWDVRGWGFINVTVQPPDNYAVLKQQSNTRVSGYPGQKQEAWVTYKNAGTQPWYDDTSVPSGGNPLHLAETTPINRVSQFYDSGTWINNTRPSKNFAAVYESDGTTLASDQHVAQPGQIVKFDFLYTLPFGGPYQTTHEILEPVLEGASNWDIGQQTSFDVTTIQPKDYQANFSSMSGYPTIQRGNSATTWIRYQNTGAAPWYDDTSASGGSHPVHFADTNSINRVSSFYDPNTWINNTRPSKNFAAVYESDGTTLASDQHVAQPGQIVEFRFTYAVPSQTAPGTYREWVQPVLEFAPNWQMGGYGFFDVTVTP